MVEGADRRFWRGLRRLGARLGGGPRRGGGFDNPEGGEKKDAWSRGKGWSGVVEGFHLTDRFPPRPCNHLRSSIGQYWV